jgi:hypothetical protein
MLRHVALVRTAVSEEHSASFIRVTRIGELGTTLAATSNRRKLRRNISVRLLLVAASVVLSLPTFVTLMKEAPGSSETSVLTRAARRNIPEDTILQLIANISNWRSKINTFTTKMDHFGHSYGTSPLCHRITQGQTFTSSVTYLLTINIRANAVKAEDAVDLGGCAFTG